MTLTFRSARLPPELWHRVFSYAERPDQISLLYVSRPFHDIVLRILFANLKIYLVGGALAFDVAGNTSDPEQWIDEFATKYMRRSWELLDRISTNPSFAIVIRSLTIVAVLSGPAVFEKSTRIFPSLRVLTGHLVTLARAISALPRLRAFRWIGEGPSLDSSIAAFLPSSLESLTVNSCVSFIFFTENALISAYSRVPWHSLLHLRSTTALDLPTPWIFPEDEESHDFPLHNFELAKSAYLSSHNPQLSELPMPLKSLSATFSHLRYLSVRLLNGLDDLAICDSLSEPSSGQKSLILGDTFTGRADEEQQPSLPGLIEFALYHANSLQSLSIFGMLICDDIFISLAAAAASLPNLTSFSYILLPGYHPETPPLVVILSPLKRFLQGREDRLRRLHFRHDKTSEDDLYDLMDFLSHFKKLEVFGLCTGQTLIEDEALAWLVMRLPPDVRALHLNMNWAGASLLPLVSHPSP